MDVKYPFRLLCRHRRYICSYLRCVAKTGTFLFWVFLYIVIMKLTFFKQDNNKIDMDELEFNKSSEMMLMQDEWATDFVEEEQHQYHNYGDVVYSEIKKELEDRVRQVQKTCTKYNVRNTLPQINHQEFFVASAFGLIWCNIFKAASSYWMYNFNILGGYSPESLGKTRKLPIGMAREKFPRPSLRQLQDASSEPYAMSFMIVREPFERLLSAYRDKLEDMQKPFYKTLGRRIVKRYRRDSNLLFGSVKSKGPTFYEFVRFLVDSNKRRKKLNEHWMPYYQFCTPCSYNFTVIAKLETLKRDSEYIIKESGLESMLLRPVKVKKVRIKTIMNKARDGRDTKALLRKYFGELDMELLEDLTDIYRFDFEMFGYDPDIYKEYVRP